MSSVEYVLKDTPTKAEQLAYKYMGINKFRMAMYSSFNKVEEELIYHLSKNGPIKVKAHKMFAVTKKVFDVKRFEKDHPCLYEDYLIEKTKTKLVEEK
tara:strand:- start:799 stop:1092 length:294 start_codon:yes stop_codon:yes gene_type:complete